MSFENPLEENNQEQNDSENTVEESAEIRDTSSFNEAIERGQLQLAENWLMENEKNLSPREVDHRSLSLFRAYRKAQDWESAKRMIDLAQDEDGKRGRRLKLAEESGISY